MAQGSASSLVLDAAFDAEDPRFVEFLREVEEPKRLAAIVDRWKRDPRPWARAQQLAYLDLPFDRRGHEVVVKRLFKEAEERGDDEILGACMAAFDRLVRRRFVKQWRRDRATSQTVREEVLVLPRDRMPPVGKTRKHVNPRDGSRMDTAERIPKNARLFTQATRRHLRRRAWRHFRRMGFQRPDAYVGAVAAALRLATDYDVAPPGALLECWGLLHACFGRHDALAFDVVLGTMSRRTRPPPETCLRSAKGDAARHVGRLADAVRRVVADEGFAVNEKKTRTQRRSASQRVTGIVVNDRPGVPRATVRRLRAILHRARKEGLAAQNRSGRPEFEAWLRGMIAYVEMVDRTRGTELRRELAEVQA